MSDSFEEMAINLSGHKVINEDLVCNNCKYKLDDREFPVNTYQCIMFSLKPNVVLMGDKCAVYSKKS